jgi:hypothetical protein
MGRDTKRQRIMRGIHVLFIVCEKLDRIYGSRSGRLSVFGYIESKCHFVVLHGMDCYEINFNEEIKLLEEFISRNEGRLYSPKKIREIYNTMVKINNLIKSKGHREIKH